MRRPTLSPEIDALITALPKAELHIHLEGSIRPITLITLARRNGINIGCSDEADVRAMYAYKDFANFLQLYSTIASVLQKPEDFVYITQDLGREAALQNIHYLEVTFSAVIHYRRKGIPFGEMIDALTQGAATVKQQTGVEMRFILDHVRGYPLELCQQIVDWCVQGRGQGVVAIGLGGFEPDWPASLYAEAFHRAHLLGVPFIPHAGEAAGPESIWDVLQFDPPRIEHGFRAIEDQTLVKHLRERGITLDISPSSNVCTGNISSLSAHPLRQLWDAGVLITLNSDDPPMFNTTLTDEYRLAFTHFGFTLAELAQLSLIAVDSSLLPSEEKKRLEMIFWREINRLGIAPYEKNEGFINGDSKADVLNII